MSESNVEIVRRMYECFQGGDAEGALAHFHPEAEVDVTMRVDGGTGRGREELAAIVGHWVGAFDEWHEEIEEMRDLGSHVYVIAVQRGRGKATGIEVENRYAMLYEVREDKITRLTMYRDADEALEAAG